MDILTPWPFLDYNQKLDSVGACEHIFDAGYEVSDGDEDTSADPAADSPVGSPKRIRPPVSYVTPPRKRQCVSLACRETLDDDVLDVSAIASICCTAITDNSRDDVSTAVVVNSEMELYLFYILIHESTATMGVQIPPLHSKNILARGRNYIIFPSVEDAYQAMDGATMQPSSWIGVRAMSVLYNHPKKECNISLGKTTLRTRTHFVDPILL